jgi:hypothetical protein
MTRMLLLAILILGPAAEAQIGPIRTPLPGLPIGVPGLPGGLGPAGGAQQLLGAPISEVARLEQARKRRIELLLRRHADVLEADPSGDPIVRGELLAFSPTDAALGRALGAGFSMLHQSSLAPLGVRIAVLGAPRGTSTRRALDLLRRLDPGGTYDYNNIYTDSGAAAGRGVVPPPAGGAGLTGESRVTLGLIDGGVEMAQPVFHGTVIHQHGCGGVAVPTAHGTEVASLMIGRSARFAGAAPGAMLYAADVYCGKPTGGSVDAIVEALAWLAGERVAVINVSLVGPPNVLLQQVVKRMVGRGFLIVAAVGNDGPAAPPLYPAAYPGVVGVTAVDARRRVLFEAERGPQVMFAAPGADIVAATMPEGFEKVRGTSFAAPLVAGLLAGLRVNLSSAGAAIDALARTALHLGDAGRNSVFGYGLVGANLPAPGPAARE